MRKRKQLWVVVFFLGLSFGGGRAFADLATEKDKAPVKSAGKSKAGGACKADADCDQAGRSQRCRDSKCEYVPSHPVT